MIGTAMRYKYILLALVTTILAVRAVAQNATDDQIPYARIMQELDGKTDIALLLRFNPKAVVIRDIFCSKRAGLVQVQNAARRWKSRHYTLEEALQNAIRESLQNSKIYGECKLDTLLVTPVALMRSFVDRDPLYIVLMQTEDGSAVYRAW